MQLLTYGSEGCTPWSTFWYRALRVGGYIISDVSRDLCRFII
jgi:hypothetical protein